MNIMDPLKASENLPNDLTQLEVLDSDMFNRLVEKRKTRNGTYLDIIIEICEEYQIEPSAAAKLLSNPIKEKLRVEAQDINFLPRTSRLPL